MCKVKSTVALLAVFLVSIVSSCPPDLSLCGYQNDIVDANGQYQKSLCLVKNSESYASSALSCQSNNMELFVLDSYQTQQQFTEKISHDMAVYWSTAYVWINGEKQNSSWYTNAPDQAPLSSEIQWTPDSSGNCIQFSGRNWPFSPISYDCSQQAWFVCEFQRDFTAPPNTQSCAATQDHNDANGNYEKSSCWQQTSYNYFEGESSCHSNNMLLFDIDSPTIEQEFRSTASSQLSAYPGAWVWVNGQKVNNAWYTFEPNRTPLFNGISWSDEQSTGDCLQFSERTGPFRVAGIDCYTDAWFYCEYNKSLISSQSPPAPPSQPTPTGQPVTPSPTLSDLLYQDFSANLGQTPFTSINSIQSITQTPVNCGALYTFKGNFEANANGRPVPYTATVTMWVRIDSSGQENFVLTIVKQKPVVVKCHAA